MYCPCIHLWSIAEFLDIGRETVLRLRTTISVRRCLGIDKVGFRGWALDFARGERPVSLTRLVAFFLEQMFSLQSTMISGRSYRWSQLQSDALIIVRFGTLGRSSLMIGGTEDE